MRFASLQFKRIFRTIYFAVISLLVSGNSFALDQQDSKASVFALMFDAYPVFSETNETASLEYFPEEFCHRQVSKSCETFQFSCSQNNPNTFDLKYWGMTIGFANFSGSIRSGYERPHIIFEDRLLQKNHEYNLQAPELDPSQTDVIVNFFFKKGKKLKEFGDDAYLLHWDTRSKHEAAELTNMLSSDEPVLLSYPVGLRLPSYFVLHSRAKTDKSDLASDFTSKCNQLWNERVVSRPNADDTL